MVVSGPGAHRPGSLRDRWLIVVALVVVSAGCAKVFEYPATQDETSAAVCSDGYDNDLDGFADCYDPDCVSLCEEKTPTACADGIDNDVDGELDCKDSDCAEHCSETGATCSNGTDDDSDSLVDCDDPDCDGQCPEESDEACADGRDNDGDSLTDGSDPRCWLLLAPVVERCAAAQIDFRDRFDIGVVELDWAVFGLSGGVTGAGTQLSPYEYSSQSNALEIPEGQSETRWEGIVSRRSFSGSWSSFQLGFKVATESKSTLRVSLTRAASLVNEPTPSGDEPFALTLDTTTEPARMVLLTLNGAVSAALPSIGFQACGNYACPDSWADVSVRSEEGSLVATFKSPAGEVSLSSPVLGTQQLPESRLVLVGRGSASFLVDDLRLGMATDAACGFRTLQIPMSSCELSRKLASAGQAVAVAQGQPGDLCALVTGASAASGDAEADSVSVWASPDGAIWSPAAKHAADALLGLPADTAPQGVGLTFDAGQFWAAVTVAGKDGRRLLLGHGSSCSTLSSLQRSARLPDDAEGPSYVVTKGRHEVYFTRPPTNDVGRTLWRLSGPDAESLELEREPLAELPGDSQLKPPVSLSRVGASDLVLIYPSQSTSGNSGLGLMVGSSDARVWRALPANPVLESEHIGSFDSGRIAAAALSFPGPLGLVLYAGQDTDRLATGVARFIPSGVARPPAAPVAKCGDGTCDEHESCRTCVADCECPDQPLLAGDLGRAADAWVVTTIGEQFDPAYIDPQTGSVVLPDFGETIWAEYPLEQELDGDFELMFDVKAPSYFSYGETSIYVGLAPSQDHATSEPRGVLVRISAMPTGSLCGGASSFAARPYIGSAEGTQSPRWCEGILLEAGDQPAPARLVLQRASGVVTLRRVDPAGCEQVVSLEQQLATLPFSSVLVGTPNSAASEISNLWLRLMASPSDCGALTRCDQEGRETVCADTSSSHEHCGACGTPCKSGAVCSAGDCACADGLSDCPEACVDLQTAQQNCGACGNACVGVCLLGECDAGESCSAPKPIPARGGTFWLDLPGAETDELYCGNQPIGGADLVLAWTPEASGTAVLTLQGALDQLDTLLSVTTDPSCEDFAPSACSDDEPTFGPQATGSRVTLRVVSGQTYYIVAALIDSAVPGPALLTVETP